MATQISEYVNTSDNYIKDFEWCEKSTKILDKQYTSTYSSTCKNYYKKIFWIKLNLILP